MSDTVVEQPLGAAGHKRQRDEDAASDERRGKVRINEERVVVAAADEDDDVGPAIPAGFVPHAAHIDNAEEDDDVGPAVPAGIAINAAPKVHKPRELPMEHLYLEALPTAGMYEKSYMHRDTVTHVLVTARAEFIVTASSDGVLNFWKKIPQGIEFAKKYKAHIGPIISLVASPDGLRLCSVGEDRTIKLYDVLNFDMVDMAKLDFDPAFATWIYQHGAVTPLLAIADRREAAIHIFDADNLLPSTHDTAVDDDVEREEVITMAAQAPVEGPAGKKPAAAPLYHVRCHAAPVLAMAYNEAHNTVISADAKGILEYWQVDAEQQFRSPAPPAVKFSSKFDTDLYDIAKAKAYPQSIAVSPTGNMFVTTSTDRKVRLFRFKTGKLARVYSESIETYEALHAEGKITVDALDFGRRMAVEKDLLAATTAAIKAFLAPAPEVVKAPTGRAENVYRPPASNAVFDESGNFIIYPSPLGIKIVNLITNKICGLLGQVENSERFVSVALYQGIPKSAGSVKSTKTLLMSEGGADGPKVDPTIISCAFRRNRFYLFSRREPADVTAMTKEGRDVFNEPPSKEDLAVATEASIAIQRAKLGSEATIHTSMGDITFKMLPEVAPKAVENFCGHSRSGYFNGLVFHRVIKDFMIQTGDPRGDGTGGASIWGHDFEDETDKAVRFDRPGAVAMANAGPCTNGSQFFVSTAPCTWLDGKHTIFGRVTKGMEVVKAIESVPTRKTDKPYDDIKIINVTIK